MNMIIQIVTAIALTLSIIVPFGCFFLGEKSKKRYKKSLIANCFLFFGVLLAATVVGFAGTASVQAASSADGLATGLGYLGAALVTGIFMQYKIKVQGNVETVVLLSRETNPLTVEVRMEVETYAGSEA